jgi:hypothetical protein
LNGGIEETLSDGVCGCDALAHGKEVAPFDGLLFALKA